MRNISSSLIKEHLTEVAWADMNYNSDVKEYDICLSIQRLIEWNRFNSSDSNVTTSKDEFSCRYWFLKSLWSHILLKALKTDFMCLCWSNRDTVLWQHRFAHDLKSHTYANRELIVKIEWSSSRIMKQLY